MEDLRKQVGERINALRRARGLTQNELAEKVELDGRHISRLETGKHYPSLDTLASMAAVLEVEIQEFFLFPTMETESQMRDALIEIARQASEPELRGLLSFARSQAAVRERQ
ncbi:helix-turn-helix domain-containing protein [Alcanivorax sp. VBW004]|uniref:helix-turn-helix domain-containing protein n=1 Tax=Alcanivorax sp. VBW004 TaxID=1287708 RepID=UPI0012BC7B2F|nr:helix-turn-helix transcriptional regulator [Alcanivorax sp. VBW004]MTT54194.1 helix-turn-helix domain-containing protein [Alcanivorax sp. VBW004]